MRDIFADIFRGQFSDRGPEIRIIRTVLIYLSLISMKCHGNQCHSRFQIRDLNQSFWFISFFRASKMKVKKKDQIEQLKSRSVSSLTLNYIFVPKSIQIKLNIICYILYATRNACLKCLCVTVRRTQRPDTSSFYGILWSK